MGGLFTHPSGMSAENSRLEGDLVTLPDGQTARLIRVKRKKRKEKEQHQSATQDSDEKQHGPRTSPAVENHQAAGGRWTQVEATSTPQSRR